MTSTTAMLADDLVEEYLDDLDHALRELPRARRRELKDELAAHIAEARGRLDDPDDERAVLVVLARLGRPADIAAEELHDRPPAAGDSPRRVWATLVLLLFGGFAGGIGWLAGLALLWTSARWTTREKLLGTLVIPGGLVTTFGAGLAASRSEHCVDGSCTSSPDLLGYVLFAMLVLAPLTSAAILASRARRPARD